MKTNSHHHQKKRVLMNSGCFVKRSVNLTVFDRILNIFPKRSMIFIMFCDLRSNPSIQIKATSKPNLGPNSSLVQLHILGLYKNVSTEIQTNATIRPWEAIRPREKPLPTESCREVPSGRCMPPGHTSVQHVFFETGSCFVHVVPDGSPQVLKSVWFQTMRL